MKDLSNKKVLFIICGGISAYKSLETIRMFRKNNAEIKTILTKSAKEFVTPLSVASLTQGKVYDASTFWWFSSSRRRHFFRFS